MPAGIVKTPSSARTKDATVAVAKSAEKTASGGKKFVQTRLPFKLITPGGGGGGGGGGGTGATASPSASTSASDPSATVILDDDEDTDLVSRKRKLSYGDESPMEGTGCSADSKENLDVGSAIATKKVKTAAAAMDVDSLAEDVIELIDDDDEAMAEKHEQEAVKEKETRPKPRKPEAKKASTTPIQIKLPLVGKRPKRRKSLKKSEDCEDTPAKGAGKTGSESSDDIEVLSEELNPQKKLKVQETVAVEVDQSPEKSPEAKKQEEKNAQTLGKPKEASKESKEEPQKKNDQSTIDLFMAKKVESSKKEKPELKTTEKGKKKDQPRAEDAKAKEATKKDTTKVLGKPKKEENNMKEDVKASTAELQKEKEDAAAKTQKEETNKKNVQITQKKEKPQAQAVEKEKTKKEEPAVPEKPKTVESSPQEKSDKESPISADISVILSSSEDNSSSSDHEMDVDTDAQKDGLLHRKSLQETSSNAQKTLTPKQQRLMERRKKAREEKEQKLAEERRLKQQEKEEREQLKKQERDEKEQQRKLEKDQKEQLRRTEKEEKERKRQAEVDSKNEEKRKRNEAKEEVQRKRDEERRKKEQEREEAAQKKKRAAESFSKFFVPKQPKAGGAGSTHNTSCLEHEQSSCDSSKASSQTLAFRPFQIKDDMLLAPIVRGSLAQKQRSQLDTLFRHRNEDDDDDDDDDEEEEDFGRRRPLNRAHLYLSELSSGRRQPLRMLRDARLQRRTKDEEEEDEVQVIDDLSNAGLPIEEEQPKQLARMRAKYLQFADNRRPAYYGTWRKKSTSISARRPLAQDKLHFDYELDSDCEWEEEEPGESLSASEDEKERESEEESEEEYNEWYVPHGHLSDEELQNDGDEGAMDDGHTREAQKAKLQVLQQEFAQEMKKQTKKMKSRLLGPVWLDENGNKSQLFPAIFAHTIDMYACWQLEPLSLEPPVEQEREDQVPEQPAPLQLDNRLMHQLVRLTHGNRNSKAFLINEYLEYLKTQTPNQTLLPSKAVLREKFDELASWKTVELGTPTEVASSGSGSASGSTAKTKTKKPKKRLCWVVPPELLEKFQLPELPLQNQWDYTLTPKVSEGTDAPQHEQSPPAEAEASARPSTASSAPTTPSTGQATTPATQGAKKRATLIMSVPRDQPIHAATKNHLISQFLRRQSESATSSPRDKPQDKPKNEKQEKREKPPPTDSEDVVMLSD
ncbi:chromatin assembly factor 1 subunit A [Drosophila gunungcola]|uniref:chromatin assembly factor 1 subunit A n=1 Tax=Drosophila gunungcola TaxID=103775 RepID=UPI0022E98246|nr:chromatin assembly factor 1 subunit A [Drosophila gunungcola]